jgi:hypothetical protein
VVPEPTDVRTIHAPAVVAPAGSYRRRMLTFDRLLRYGLPALIFGVCVAVLIISPDLIGLEAVGILFGGGAAVVMVNYIQRVGFAGDVERTKEAEVREFFQRYGMWPGQASPELLEQARQDGMLEHVTVKPRRRPPPTA